MKVLIKKKIYLGRVELRDYEVDRLVENKITVKVVIDNPEIPEHREYMILTPTELKDGQYINTQFSKFNKGQTYLLRGYKWKGIKNLDEAPSIDINAKKRMSQMWKDVLKQKSG